MLSADRLQSCKLNCGACVGTPAVNGGDTRMGDATQCETSGRAGSPTANAADSVIINIKK